MEDKIKCLAKISPKWHDILVDGKPIPYFQPNFQSINKLGLDISQPRYCIVGEAHKFNNEIYTYKYDWGYDCLTCKKHSSMFYTLLKIATDEFNIPFSESSTEFRQKVFNLTNRFCKHWRKMHCND